MSEEYGLQSEVREPANSVKKERGLKNLSGSTAAKAAAFIILLISVCVAVAALWGARVIAQEELYTTSKEAYTQETFRELFYSDQGKILYYLRNNQQEAAASHCAGENIATVTVTGTEGETVWSWQSEQAAREEWTFTQTTDYGYGEIYTVSLTLAEELLQEDQYAFANWTINLGYSLRYAIYGIAALAGILTLVCYIFLLCAAGHHRGEEGVQAGWGTQIPLDLLTAASVIGMTTLGRLFFGEVLPEVSESLVLAVAIAGGAFALMVAAAVGFSMSLALRLKLGEWWKNTVVYKALRLGVRLGRRIGGAVASLLRSLPLILGAVVLFGSFCLVEGLFILLCHWEFDRLIVFWFLEKLVLFPVVVYAAMMLRRLQIGGKALAQGDLAYQVNTERMVGSLRQHGENLNSIAIGMNRAVEERMKSERMKTELVANVSHDIKTPLTSIINYADLIGREDCDNAKIQEYAGVLLRQSERLKKLIEDLIEVSKATTGNMEVNLAPCEIGVLLTQTSGEYAQRLLSAQLELVTRQPEQPVTIIADRRCMWRVFDNLLNNICKYAQSGTRVYLTLEIQGKTAIISFKNISKTALDIPSSELMERFVRGDRSRNTEGNGLGLSIAKSLTELQNGTFELKVDGDLFKAELHFPLVG